MTNQEHWAELYPNTSLDAGRRPPYANAICTSPQNSGSVNAFFNLILIIFLP